MSAAAASPRRMPVQDRARHKRAALLAAAAEEFAAREYPEVTTKTIAERAGVAAGTFYQYFQDKDAILCEVARERLKRLTDRIVDARGRPLPRILEDAPIIAHIRASLELTYQFHIENPRLHGTIEHRRALDPALEAIVAEGDRIILERVTAALRGWRVADAQTAAYLIVSMAEGLIHRLAFGPPAADKDAALAAGAEILTRYLEGLIPAASPGAPEVIS